MIREVLVTRTDQGAIRIELALDGEDDARLRRIAEHEACSVEDLVSSIFQTAIARIGEDRAAAPDDAQLSEHTRRYRALLTVAMAKIELQHTSSLRDVSRALAPTRPLPTRQPPRASVQLLDERMEQREAMRLERR